MQMPHTAATVFDLIEHGRYPDAREALDALTTIRAEHQALRSLIEVETADPAVALNAAKALLKRPLTNREQALCLLIVGRASSISGQVDEACSALRQAVFVAAACNDLTLAARAQARLTKTLLRFVGIEAATAEVSQLRKSAHVAGDRRAVADFHCVVAEIEMKRRNYARALKHLQLAENVSDEPLDLAMKGQIGRLTANVALLASEPRVALRAILPTVKIFERSGSKYSLMASLSTLAEYHLIVGAFSDAETVLSRIRRLSESKESRLTTLDSLMIAALGRGSLDGAAQLAAAIDSLGTFPDNHYSWLWHVSTRARWLVAIGRPAEALSLLREHRDVALKTSDERLAARYLLLEAEATVAAVSPSAGAARLSFASTALPTLTLEDVAEINRIASRVCSPSAGSFEFRARRIRSIALSAETRTYPLRLSFDASGTPSDLLHSAAALFSIPLHAELLAHETAALLHASGATDDISIAAADPATPSATTPHRARAAERVEIDIHDQTGVRYIVSTRPRPEPDAWLSLMAVQALVRSALALSESRLRDRLEPSLWPDTLMDDQRGMIVAAASMTELLNVTRRVATSNVTVLFTGETGTGKELLARALHDASPRREKPFIPFNCTAAPRDMLDSQLFGYRRGAFTGALEAFQGVVRAAAGGTLFLDEIGEMPLDVQPKLLRFLESGEIHPLGEPRPIAVDVRLVAATNAQLEQLVADGRFREDLFYRLNVVRLQVPPLRERREEIPLLAQHFIDVLSREGQKSKIRLAEETMEYLVLYKWPGNVRQLANELRRMVAFAESGAVLMPEHLSREIAASRRTIPASQRDTAPSEVVVRLDQPFSAAVEHLERSMIQYAMTIAEGRQEDAAQLLGLSRKGLYLKRARLKMAI
jgi:DNA-binding NtrC family response regulator